MMMHSLVVFYIPPNFDKIYQLKPFGAKYFCLLMVFKYLSLGSRVNINFICPLMIKFVSIWTSIALTILPSLTPKICSQQLICKPTVITTVYGDNTKNHLHHQMTQWGSTKVTGWISKLENTIDFPISTSITRVNTGLSGLSNLPNQVSMRKVIPMHQRRFRTCALKLILAQLRSGRLLATTFPAQVLIHSFCH